MMTCDMGNMNTKGKKKPKMKSGGSLPYLKSGKKDSPLETAKRKNGIPGYKGGGDVKKKC